MTMLDLIRLALDETKWDDHALNADIRIARADGTIVRVDGIKLDGNGYWYVEEESR